MEETNEVPDLTEKIESLDVGGEGEESKEDKDDDQIILPSFHWEWMSMDRYTDKRQKYIGVLLHLLSGSCSDGDPYGIDLAADGRSIVLQTHADRMVSSFMNIPFLSRILQHHADDHPNALETLNYAVRAKTKQLNEFPRKFQQF